MHTTLAQPRDFQRNPLRQPQLAPLIGLLFVVVSLFALVALPPLADARAEQMRVRLEAVRQFSDSLTAAENDMQQMQAALRGYLLSQTPAFLEQYQAPQGSLRSHLERTRELAILLEPDLVPRIAELDTLTQRWQREGAERQITLAQQDRLREIRAMVAEGGSQAIFDAFRSDVNDLQRQAQQIQLSLSDQVSRARTVQAVLTTGLGVLGLLAAGLVIVSFRRTSVLVRALDDERAHAAALADQLHIQLDTAERRNRQLTIFNDVASAAALSIQPEQRARNVLQAIVRALGFDTGAIWTCGNTQLVGQLLREPIDHTRFGVPRPASEAPAALPPEAIPLLDHFARADAPGWYAPQAAEPEHGSRQLWTILAPHTHGGVLLPLRSSGEPIGVLILTMLQPGQLPEDDQVFLMTLAAEVGLVLKNALLYDVAQTERQRLQIVFDHSLQGIVTVAAPDGRVVLANQAALNLFDAAVQPDVADLAALAARIIHLDGRPCRPEDLPLTRAVRDGLVSQGVELVVQQPGGQRIPVLVTSVPTYDADQTLSGAVGVFQDLRQLREVERLKSDFVALVSHELRTPLTIIKGCVHGLLDDTLGADPVRARELLHILAAQSERLHDLVDNLLNLSQVESGTLRVQRELIALAPLIKRVQRQLRERLAGLRVQTDLPPQLPLVNADERRIEQVLINLLDNARKFSPSDGTITVSAQHAGEMVVMSVRDQGPGISFAERERVFERFYQIEQPATRRFGGTGLGLAICKSIIEAHSGRIWVEDASGGGAMLCVALPAQPEDERVQRSTSARLILRPKTTRTTVLVVDDDPALRRLIEHSLPESGYQVQTVAEAQSAIEAVAHNPPDLVLLDLMLPGVDGFALCRELREWTSVPIMMLTARTAEQDIVRGLALGADDYVTKPFRINELIARMEAVLRRARPDPTVGGLSLIQVDALVVDLAQRRVTVDGLEITLTPTEYRILAFLARHAGQVLTHDQILQDVWGAEYAGESQYLWVHIAHLRQKIEADSKQPRYILTERGVGYRLAGS